MNGVTLQGRASPQGGIVSWCRYSVQDPKLYFTIALFAGENGPSFFKIGSGWMFLFAFVGMVLLCIKRRFEVRRSFSIVLLIYAVVLLRNISRNPAVANYYELPNLGTAVILLLLNDVFFKDEDIRQIEGYFLMYAALLAGLGVLKLIQHPTVRLAVFGGPNGYYKIALLFEVLCFSRYLDTKKFRYVICAIIGMVLCIATGSKGGIAAMMVVLTLELFFFVFNAGERRRLIVKRILQIFAFAAVGCAAVAVLIRSVPGLSVLFARATSFLTSDNISNATSVKTRVSLINLGMRFFSESPLIGKGARYTYFYTNGAQPYPHNIFVEFLSEQGLLGTIPFVLFLLGLIYKALRYGVHDSRLFCLFLCFAVYFSGSLFSGNLLDSKPIFVFGVLIHNYVLNLKKSHVGPLPE